MKPEKITSNLEFDVKYADGSRKEVQEGVLFEFKGDKVYGHIGTSRKEALFSIAKSLSEMIIALGLAEEFAEYIEEECQEMEIMSDKMPNNCRLIREMGEPGKDGNGKCMGFTRSFTDDEPYEICKKCEWCTAREEGD